MPIIKQSGSERLRAHWHLHPSQNLDKDTQAMTKSLEVLTEAVRDPKHPFRKVDDQPKKPQKHRYERRKIKEFLHLGDWLTVEAT
jgi:hypothetical protein